MRENFEHAKLLSEGQEHIPVAEILFMVGFFLVYFIEEFVQLLWNSDHHGSAQYGVLVEPQFSLTQIQQDRFHRFEIKIFRFGIFLDIKKLRI